MQMFCAACPFLLATILKLGSAHMYQTVSRLGGAFLIFMITFGLSACSGGGGSGGGVTNNPPTATAMSATVPSATSVSVSVTVNDPEEIGRAHV